MDSRGTLILSVRTPDGVYLASDSRGTNPLTDSAQKIVSCGQSGFLALCGTIICRAALPGESVATLDLTAMLGKISSEYDGTSDLVEHAALRAYAMLKPFWQYHVEPAPEAFLNSQTVKESICTIPIVDRRPGAVRVWEVQFPFSTSGELLKPIYRERVDEVIAWGQLPKDPAAIPFPSNSRRSVLRYIDAMYAVSTLFHPETVGGPTDVGFVDLNGAEWVRRKGFH